VAWPRRAAGSPAYRREASWSQHPAGLAQESETGLRRPAALRVLALPQAQVEPASERRLVQSRVAWRRRAALVFAHRAAAASRVQRVALPRMEARAAACVPAERQSGARAAVYAQAEPRLAASVRAALAPEAVLDAQAAQPREVAESAVPERQPGAAPLAVPVQRPEAAVVPVAQGQQPVARRDAARHQEAARQGAAAVQAASARRLAAPALVAASACRPGRLPPSVPLVPRPAARFAHAMRSLSAASPSMRSWQAARGEGLSSWQVPGTFLAMEGMAGAE
jgi:hypothetical protein